MALFGIAAGELPDIDVIFGSTPEALMSAHRGITHALIWQPLLASLVVLPFYIWLCRKSAPSPAGVRPAANHDAFGLGRLFLVALFALYTHIYLDCMTTYGTQIFLPFSDIRVAFSSMFIVDLLLTMPPLALMIYAWRLPPAKGASALFSPERTGARRHGQALPEMPVSGRARRIARIAIAWMLLYPLASLGINAAVAALRSPSLASGASLRLLTEPFSPFVWKAVIEDARTYRMGTLCPFSPDEPLLQNFVQPEAMLYESLKRQHPIFRQFEKFAPFMIQTERPTDYMTQMDYTETVREYAFADLRYIISADSPARFFGREDPNFILEARVNDSGALLAYRFLRRGKLRSTPWILLQ
jgi:inner membrane protein